jgi:hypothetical protein
MTDTPAHNMQEHEYVEPEDTFVQLRYRRYADNTLELLRVVINGNDRTATPTLNQDGELTWFVEGEGKQTGDSLLLTFVPDPEAVLDDTTLRANEHEGMFAVRKRVELAAKENRHKLASWSMLDKMTNGMTWIGTECLNCGKPIELEPVPSTSERVAHYRIRTSVYLRQCTQPNTSNRGGNRHEATQSHH